MREETGYKVAIEELLGIHSRVIPVGRRLTEGATEPLHALRIVYRAHDHRRARCATRSTDRPIAPSGSRSEAVRGLQRVKLVDIGLEMAGAI